MIHEYAFSCSDAGVSGDSPFCLCRGFPPKLVPCSAQPIADSDVVNELLVVERADNMERVDPITFLPFTFEVRCK